MEIIEEKDSAFECEIQAPCFQALSASEIQLIRQGKTQVMFRKGENLTKQGSLATFVMFIVKGLAKQYIEDETGRNLNLQVLQAGDFVGLSSIFDNPLFRFSSVAITDTLVYMIDKNAIKNVLKQNGDFAYNIIMRHNEQTDKLYDVIKSLNFKQMNGRLADVLLYLGALPYVSSEVFGNMSRKDIADFAGLSTESTVKLLKVFEKDGIIALNEKNITILRKDLLQEISKRG